MTLAPSRRSTCPHPILAAALALLLAFAVLSLSTTASAQDATEAAGQADAQTDQPEDAGDGIVGELDLSGMQTFVIAAILLTAAGIFAAYLFVANNSQREAYRALVRLGLRGIPTRVEYADSWQRPASMTRDVKDTNAAEEITFKVTVPDRLVVGQPVEATATVTGVDNPEVTWSSSDPALEITPHGLKASVMGTKPGLYILKAALVGQTDPKHIKEIPIEVAEPKAAEAGVAIPFTNAGIATFGVLMFLLALLASLGIARVIDGDLLMTVITTVVGGLIGAGAVAATTEKG